MDIEAGEADQQKHRRVIAEYLRLKEKAFLSGSVGTLLFYLDSALIRIIGIDAKSAITLFSIVFVNPCRLFT
jgi:hypothetical protein